MRIVSISLASDSVTTVARCRPSNLANEYCQISPLGLPDWKRTSARNRVYKHAISKDQSSREPQQFDQDRTYHLNTKLRQGRLGLLNPLHILLLNSEGLHWKGGGV